jgi:thiamine-phosphate pyrophosphorylase
LVLDRAAARGGLEERVASAVRAGVDWVQVRERDLGGAALLELADAVAAAARRAAAESGGEVRIVVNRRADVALAIGADGVHLGFDAMDPATARRLLGPDALVGVSAHSAEEVGEAETAGASYVHLAPVFQPLSKAASRTPCGLGGLAAVASRRVPVLAQGGVDASNAREVLAAGATGVAVTGAILMAEDPGAAAAALREALDGHATHGPCGERGAPC